MASATEHTGRDFLNSALDLPAPPWSALDGQTRSRFGITLTLRERTIKAAWDNPMPLPAAVQDFFDRFAHDSIAGFDDDASRLSDWRTIYFGETKYKPS